MTSRATPETTARDDGALVEVAVALPLPQTFTYRDPRPGVRIPLGTQVVVRFGPRTVTGFVVGYTNEARGDVRDLEAVIDGEPAVGEDVLELCRWAAAYYLAPIGELLRTALPQGERLASERRVRLTGEGRRLMQDIAAGRGGLRGLALAPQDRVLLERLAKTSTLSQRALLKLEPSMAARLSRLADERLVEVGDLVRERARAPVVRVATITDAAAPAPAERARAQRALWTRLRESPDGIAVDGLAARERTALRALVSSGVARIDERRPEREPRVERASSAPPALNEHQAAALRDLEGALAAGGYAPFLLQGITGSGKTEVYLRLIAAARAAGKGALVLVPEIALTPQLASRFRARFGDEVAVLHSALAPNERLAAWRRLRAGEVSIALGARSAVFAPVAGLGVIVVDEEHDGSFKQDEGVRYHGRDLAIVRAQRAGAVLVLGSATPSLESFHNAERGRFKRLLLPTRATPGAASRPLPPVQLISLQKHALGPDGLLTPVLALAVEQTLADGDQVILFLNRRGFSTMALCRGCGSALECPQCSVAMTFHRNRGRLVCHYCGRTESLPPRCPSCSRPSLELLGTGTERVESVVRERFPGARIGRLDRDTVSGPDDLEHMMAKVHARELDILIGTQMVTKGHDFPGVTLVGVLQPDMGMNLPDFRASERTFQLLEQVAGRAGRGDRAGRVLVQTYNAQHAAMVALVDHDYDGFARRELEERRAVGYPPFTRMVAVRVDGEREDDVRRAADDAAARARAAGGDAVRVRGPAEAPIPRINGRVRWQIWLSATGRASLAAAAEAAGAAGASQARGVRLSVDVDPQSVL